MTEETEMLKNMVAERNGRIALLLSENERLKALVLGNEMELTEKDKTIKDLKWQLQEVIKDNDYYQEENEKLKKQIEKMNSIDYALNVLMNKKNFYFEDYEGKRSPISYYDNSNEVIIFKE